MSELYCLLYVTYRVPVLYKCICNITTQLTDSINIYPCTDDGYIIVQYTGNVMQCAFVHIGIVKELPAPSEQAVESINIDIIQIKDKLHY